MKTYKINDFQIIIILFVGFILGFDFLAYQILRVTGRDIFLCWSVVSIIFILSMFIMPNLEVIKK